MSSSLSTPRVADRPAGAPPLLRSLANGARLVTLVMLLAVAWSAIQVGLFHDNLINPGGWALVQQFFAAALRPELSPAFLRLTLESTLVTFAYAISGLALSLVIGFLGGLLSSEVWWLAHRPRRRSPHLQSSISILGSPWLLVRGALAVPRAIHEALWGLFLVRILGLDPLVAILALGIPFGAITAKVFSEILDETPRDALNALLNGGAPPARAMLYGLLPRAFANLTSYSFYRLECAIRSATVLGVIGAGGLGYQILLSLQSLRYQEMWTLMAALLLLSGMTDWLSARIRRALGAPTRSEVNLAADCSAEAAVRARGTPGSRALLGLFIVAVVLTPLSFWYVQPDLGRLFAPRTIALLGDMVGQMFPPDLSPANVAALFNLSVQTLAMSVFAIAVAGLFGILLAYPAAHPARRTGGAMLAYGVTRAFLLFCRAIPAPVWALLILFVMFPGPLPGALAIAVHNLGILGRLIAEAVENADKRPAQALQHAGASPLQAFLYGALPITLPQSLAYVFYRWEIGMRETVIVGFVGAGGLGRLLTEQLSSFDYSGVTATLIALLVLTFIVDVLSTAARRAIR
ncbi:MAG: phosphonate ABC transporter, permease protein PhnE [Candidatus Roseilinea sp.]|nr:MAG: phosphonate ABC transporter, permease protein PhnE [Candidatus Roseilinea sp.]